MHRSRNRFAPIVATLALVAASSAAADDVGRAFDVRGDLELTADALRETLTVRSPRHGFELGLPFSDTWRFDSDEHRPLGASDERFTLDIRARERTEQDGWSQLDEYLDALVGSRADIRFPQIVEEDDGSVICVQVRNGETAPWRWFYWTVIPSGKRWLQLALFDTRTAPLEPYDLDLVKLLAAGFVPFRDDADDPEADPALR